MKVEGAAGQSAGGTQGGGQSGYSGGGSGDLGGSGDAGGAGPGGSSGDAGNGNGAVSGSGGAGGGDGPPAAGASGQAGAENPAAASLDALTFSIGVLTPEFASDVSEYTLQLAEFEAAQVRVVASSAIPDSWVTITHNDAPTSAGSGAATDVRVSFDSSVLTVDVQAPGYLDKRYSVTLQRAPLSALAIDELAVGGNAWDEYGTSVAAGEGYVALGGPKDDTPTTGSAAYVDDDYGGVRVFNIEGPTAQEMTTLRGAGLDAGSRFGTSLAADGNVLLVGAPGEGVEGDTYLDAAGAAYVFVRSADGWSNAQRLVAESPLADAQFGTHVALRGDTIAVAAPGAHKVYLFRRDTGPWFHQKTIDLLANEPAALALSDSFLAVLVKAETGSCADGGPLLLEKADNWNAQWCLGPMNKPGTDALAVAADARTLVIAYPGLIHIYRVYAGLMVSGPWDIKNVAAEDGSAIAVRGDRLFVSAPSDASASLGINGDELDESMSSTPLGAVFMYRESPMGWLKEAYIKPTASTVSQVAGAGFGRALAFDRNTLIVGAPLHDASAQASAPSPGTPPVAGEPTGTAFVYR